MTTPAKAAPMREDVTPNETLAINRAERYAKSPHTTPEEHDDIMTAVDVARRLAHTARPDAPNLNSYIDGYDDALEVATRPDAGAPSGLDGRCGFNGGTVLSTPRTPEWMAACERLATRYDFWKLKDRASQIRAGEPGWLIEQACVEALMASARSDAGDEQAEIERLRQALEDVVNPIGVLQRSAEAEGAKLSGAAYSIANDIGYVQGIARDALAATPARHPDAGDEDVERVAMAMYDACMDRRFEGVPERREQMAWPRNKEDAEMWREHARAALAAMREGVDRGMVERFIRDAYKEGFNDGDQEYWDPDGCVASLLPPSEVTP